MAGIAYGCVSEVWKSISLITVVIERVKPADTVNFAESPVLRKSVQRSVVLVVGEEENLGPEVDFARPK